MKNCNNSKKKIKRGKCIKNNEKKTMKKTI